MSAGTSSTCFHCGEPLAGSTLKLVLSNCEQPVCCLGCKAAAEWIHEAGLGDFYRYRAQPTDRPRGEDDWSAYSRPDVAKRYVRRTDSIAGTIVLVDGLRCSACAWLIDKALRAIEGVDHVQVNSATGQVWVEWSKGDELLADILRRLDDIGFHPTVGSESASVRLADERRAGLKQLVIAVFGMMQVMMFSVAQYSADLQHDAIDPATSNYFRLISLLVTTFVVAYSGAPFLSGALRSIRNRVIGVDLSVSAAIVLAYAASVWNALSDRGEVYFDSVTMFVFFLTLTRYISMIVRHRTIGVSEALSQHLPAVAHRVTDSGIEDVDANAIVKDDILLVRVGEAVAADGRIALGASSFDESLLTGESRPLARSVGDTVIAGSINCGAPVQMKVDATKEHTVIAHVADILRRAQAERPRFAQFADRAAARFVRTVFAGAIVVCAAWLFVDPSIAFAATLAVLVAACPCAFSIAAPATFSAAAAQLAKLGILVTRIDAIEKLAAVDRCMFDKTGTLTRGATTIQSVRLLSAMTESEVMSVAAALERHSEHPIGRAFGSVATNASAYDTVVIPGRGLEGRVAGEKFRIGSLAFAYELCPGTPVDVPADGADTIVLSSEDGLLAAFYLADEIRHGASSIAGGLRALGIECEIASGDSAGIVKEIARQCGIAKFASRRLPAEKLDRIQSLQKEGHDVLAVGDGINDAPVLGAASVSIAMGQGAALAHASADMILISEDLGTIAKAVEVARSAASIAKQNLVWSAFYNLGTLPFAALGFIPPWVAAIGMSVSSTAVILNSMRLLPKRQGAAAKDRTRGPHTHSLQTGTP